MGAKTGGKSGRLIKQNGKGKGQEKEETEDGPDLSVLRQPIEISVPGLNQVVKVFQSGTPELRHLLSYECDVVYECKVCRNLFRSLANFISHKRVYCTQLYSNTHHNIYKNNKRVDDTTVFVQPEPVRNSKVKESWVTSDAAGEKEGKDVRELKTRNSQAEPAPFRITIKKDLTSIVEKLMQKNATQTLTEVVGHVSTSSEFYDGVSKELDLRQKEAKQHTVHLEPIDNTTFGVFQTIVQTASPATEFIKSQVQDLQRIMSETEAVLGPDGRVIENGVSYSPYPTLSDDKKRKSKTMEVEYNGPPVTAPESEVELYCNLCKEHFSSFKILNHHMKSLHMTFRTFYPCPVCKLPLSNSWSVYRHLLKVHRKTNEQIRKLRERVIKRAFRKEVLQSGAQRFSKSSATENPLCPSEPIYDNRCSQITRNELESDKQWFGHFEDDTDMQCCGGCGRRFERRAALQAHSHICLKRLAAKQGALAAGRQLNQPNQPDKPVAPGSTTLPGKPSSPSRILPASRSSSLPLGSLNRSLHLTNVEHVTPTKKIEIQVRRDYGKSSASSNEYRTRTPSISRSEDGAASVSKSEDGTTSGSSEAEMTGPFEPNTVVNKGSAGNGPGRHFGRTEVRRGRPPNSSYVNHTRAHESDTRLIRRSVGRPPKHRPEHVNMNGVNDSVDMVDTSSDESPTILDKNGTRSLSENINIRKRKSSTVMALELDSEGEDDALTNESNVRHDGSMKLLRCSDNEKKMAAMSNMRKLQCLTCRKKYKSLGNLRRHVAVHIGWNRFRCIMCDFKCFSKCDCIAHALSVHLEPWEKQKAMAMVQDMQMDAGGSIDALSCDGQNDSGDSESALSEAGSLATTPEKSSKHIAMLQNVDGDESIVNSNETAFASKNDGEVAEATEVTGVTETAEITEVIRVTETAALTEVTEVTQIAEVNQDIGGVEKSEIVSSVPNS